MTWMVRILKNLGIHNIKPVTLHCDSQSALHIAHNLMLHDRTKHIEVDSHFTRKKVMEGLIQLKYLLLVNWRTCSQRFFLLTTSRIYFPNLACFLPLLVSNQLFIQLVCFPFCLVSIQLVIITYVLVILSLALYKCL